MKKLEKNYSLQPFYTKLTRIEKIVHTYFKNEGQQISKILTNLSLNWKMKIKKAIGEKIFNYSPNLSLKFMMKIWVTS